MLVTKFQDQLVAEFKFLIKNKNIKSKNFLFIFILKKDFCVKLHFLPILDLNLLFHLLDKIPNIDPLLVDLETYILNEGLMVMKANSATVTNVRVF